MKKKLFVTFVVCCMVVFLTMEVSANLLVNGSFEDPSPTGWDGGFWTYSHATQVYYAGPAPAGAGETYGWAWGETTFGSATQTVDVSGMAGDTYSFSAWLSSYTADTDFARVGIEFFDGSAASLGGVEFDGSDGVSPYIVGSADALGAADPTVDWTMYNWTMFLTEGIIPVNAASAVVTLASDAIYGNANDAYVDLVTFVPEPTSMALLGLGGLAMLRRKKS